jgi:leucyl aminopeptidase (aminopeptidase T)
VASQLVTFLAGAASALGVQLVVQFWIVPKVETRKRREDRWERDVRELGELLTTSLTSLANEVHAAQLVYREVRDEQSDRYDPALVARQARDAEQAMFAYGSLIGTQVDWLIGRVISPSPKAQEIARLQRAARDYRMRAVFVRVLPEQDDRADTAFHEQWDKESNAREALIRQVVLLADLTHPPRRSRRRQNIQPAEGWHDLLGGPDPESVP